MARLKILVSAYACRPGMGSEPGVGWNVVKALAKHHDIWVFTRTDNRPALEAELAKNPIDGLHCIYFDLLGVKLWERSLYAVHLNYYLWQLQAYFVARQLLQQIDFDIIHHVTYVRYSSPSFLALLPVPFVWGPVGGGETAPKRFWQDFDLRGKFYEALRNFARFLGEYDPFVRMTARRSCIAYATTEATAHRLKAIGCRNVKVLSQVGLSSEEIAPPSDTLVNQPLIRFISVGRFLHWKGFHLGLAAFAQADLPPDAQYWLVGEGPEEVKLRTLATELGITAQVQFFKQMPRSELLSLYSQCLTLIHPSLHDSGGFVCVEAMAMGCPVICLDLGGPAVQVTAETGFKVAAHAPDQAIIELAHVLARFANEPGLRTQMGQAGQQHVQQFYQWETKAALFSQVYQDYAVKK